MPYRAGFWIRLLATAIDDAQASQIAIAAAGEAEFFACATPTGPIARPYHTFASIVSPPLPPDTPPPTG